MDDLRRMVVFACVVRHGSMSAAARELAMSPSAVSQQIRQLEREGGVTLLHRSTRKLGLTEAGERFHEHCAALAAAAERARADLRSSRTAPSGELRVSAPVGFARHVAPALGGLLADHPALELRLFVDDAQIDLIEARIDLALRFGRLPDSSWTARRLCSLRWSIWAAPDYLRSRPPIDRPEQLAQQQWIGFARDGKRLLLELQAADGSVQAQGVDLRIATNNQYSIQQMCAAGLGIATLADVDVHDEVQAGRLVRLLPGWRLPPMHISAVTPQRDAQPAKVRQAVAALAAYLGQLPGAEPAAGASAAG